MSHKEDLVNKRCVCYLFISYTNFIYVCVCVGEAIEQAYGALFLASDESSFVTGTDFRVDGGLSAAYVVSDNI